MLHLPNKKHTDSLESYDNPRDLRIKISDECIQKYISRKSHLFTMEEGRSELNDAIEVYAKLYAIKIKLDKLATAS